MCRVLKVHRSGYYAWLHEPLSPRAKKNEALTLKIREFYDHSMGIYGSPRIFCDLREAGLVCGENRVARLMRAAQIKSVRGYKRPRYRVGKPALVAPNQLQRQFQHDEPVASGDIKAMQAEMAKLKAELRRTTEERDILKKAAAYFAKQSG